jgi:hypothetical protein
MNTTIKTSISLQKPIWQLLKTAPNKSRIVNDALELYFDKQSFLQEADQVYWEKVKASLAGNTGEYISLNSDTKTVTEQQLQDKLWN